MGNENPVIEAGEFLGDNGALPDGYLDKMYHADDPLRTDATLMNTKDIRSMASQLVNSQKHIGQLTGGREFAILPNETSTEDEVNAYHTKTGRPQDAAAYGFKDLQLPDGLPKDDALADAMADIMHKAGASSKAATEIFNGYAEMMAKDQAEIKTQNDLDNANADTTLRAKFGAAYDKNMQDVAALVRSIGNDIDKEETEALLKELKYDPYSAQFLAKIATRFVEGKLLEVPAPGGGDITPSTALASINKIMTDPYYVTSSPTGKLVNMAYHDELVQKVADLFVISTNTGGVG